MNSINKRRDYSPESSPDSPQYPPDSTAHGRHVKLQRTAQNGLVLALEVSEQLVDALSIPGAKNVIKILLNIVKRMKVRAKSISHSSLLIVIRCCFRPANKMLNCLSDYRITSTTSTMTCYILYLMDVLGTHRTSSQIFRHSQS